MKKLFVWILSATLCVSLAACASAPADNTAQNTADTTQDITDAAQDITDETDTTQDITGETAEPLTEAEAAYQAKVAELEPAEGETDVHWVVFPCGTGEKILVIAPSVYGEGETMEGDVYQYADGEVKFIASVSSTGTAYPLAFTPEGLIFGGNHMSGKLVIHDGTGELYQIKDVNIEGRTPVLEVYDVLNGEGTLKSAEELSTEQADAMDYYIGAFADGTAEIIGFE
ncbi:MAG: hypothetical protein IJR72_01630 [Oscillospiraceae bacterium]|nr:hypothetical protein [Oscillospiraceae bacterium]